jgi:N-acetylglucosaminyldiphosphoundecaprenol N-acetyl-beta-D-mannosaminyltransferase
MSPSTDTPARPGAGARRVDVLACSIDVVDLSGAVERSLDLLERDDSVAVQVSVNAAKVVECSRNPRMAEFIAGCDMVNADGQAVVWAARLLGHDLPERVAGIDLMEGIFAAAAERGLSVFILGARREVLDEALANLGRRHPGLNIAGSHDGYFADADEPEVVREIADSGADILFVAMGSPKKEFFLEDHRGELGVRFAMGVGGAVDVLAGHVRRAPGWMQSMGLEWLFRLLMEPHRLWRRYLVGNFRFCLLLAAALLRRAFSSPGSSPGGDG